MKAVLAVALLICVLAAQAAKETPLFRTMVIGHRGVAAHAPENTMASFKAAKAAGADGFETDLWTTKDGVIVLCHDPTLDRTTNCSGSISSWNYADIRDKCDAGSKFSPKFAGEKIPTFLQAVQYAKEQDMFIVMDLKMEGLGQKIAEVVLPLEMHSRMIASCRSDKECLSDIGKYLNGTVHQRLDNPPSTFDETFFANYVPQNVKGFSYSFGAAFTPAFVLAAHKHLISVFAWTIDSQADLTSCARMGCDGVITDDAPTAVAVFADLQKKMFSTTALPLSPSLSPLSLSADAYRSTPLIIGHRGNSGHYPENTAVSFEAAFAAGADGFETDLWTTKDGVIVLCHDPTLDRTTNCTGAISSKTYEYIKNNCDAGSKFSKQFAGEPVPTFQKAVEIAQKHNGFIVLDLKMTGLAQKIAAIVRPLGMESHMIASCREDKEMTEDVGKFLTGAVKQRLTEPPLILTEKYLREYVTLGASGFSYDNQLTLTYSLTRKAHQHLFNVVSWTVNTKETMIKALQNNHDGLITNEPQLLAETVAELRQRVWPQ
eukprot:TRINITY_DN95_c0_g1_i1.p1 TRINITY_DN95_c0_g1~~TRINITY_DN95_c0_g1_i1.p1  ORF type:complete len:555 (+),score=168.85 TRINITY_DN95_c0_g1_i1:32-1666(+)